MFENREQQLQQNGVSSGNFFFKIAAGIGDWLNLGQRAPQPSGVTQDRGALPPTMDQSPSLAQTIPSTSSNYHKQHFHLGMDPQSIHDMIYPYGRS